MHPVRYMVYGPCFCTHSPAALGRVNYTCSDLHVHQCRMGEFIGDTALGACCIWLGAGGGNVWLTGYGVKCDGCFPWQAVSRPPFTILSPLTYIPSIKCYHQALWFCIYCLYSLLCWYDIFGCRRNRLDYVYLAHSEQLVKHDGLGTWKWFFLSALRIILNGAGRTTCS